MPVLGSLYGSPVDAGMPPADDDAGADSRRGSAPSVPPLSPQATPGAVMETCHDSVPLHVIGGLCRALRRHSCAGPLTLPDIAQNVHALVHCLRTSSKTNWSFAFLIRPH